MRLSFIHLESFRTKWRSYGLTDEDLQALEAMIMEHPEKGVVMAGTGGVRKIRFAPPSWHTGKSGATRVCYVWFVESAICGLVWVFAKNEQPNLDAKTKSLVRKIVDGLRTELARKENP
jgi:hypothetical protein